MSGLLAPDAQARPATSEAAARPRERAVLAALLALAVTFPLLAATATTARLVPAPGHAAATGAIWALGGALALALAVLAWRLRARFPAALDGAVRRHRRRAALWALLAVVALAQLGRLSAFMSDPTRTWGGAVPVAKVRRHLCMAAYARAAELARAGEPNVYDARHWPLFHGAAADELPLTSSVAELAPYVEDPYEYPPPFLLLPRAALALTNHFLVVRAAWFALQLLALTAVALLVAGTIGGRDGLRIGLLTPLLLAVPPTMVALQWGQAQVLALVLAMGAWVAFRRGREALGGALLGAAIVFKLFPGILVLYLVLRRRWRAVGWTLGAVAALSLLTLAVLGPAPFVAFARYQLPRIASGEAFAFFHGDSVATARNLGVSGLVYKLDLLGVPGMGARLAGLLGWLYTGALVALTWLAARRDGGDRIDEALVWLALTNLGALRSPFAPSIYVAAGAAWLLVLLAARARRPLHVVLIVVAMLVIPGSPPLPPTIDLVLGTLSGLMMLALCVLPLVRPARAATA